MPHLSPRPQTAQNKFEPVYTCFTQHVTCLVTCLSYFHGFGSDIPHLTPSRCMPCLSHAGALHSLGLRLLFGQRPQRTPSVSELEFPVENVRPPTGPLRVLHTAVSRNDGALAPRLTRRGRTGDGDSSGICWRGVMLNFGRLWWVRRSSKMIPRAFGAIDTHTGPSFVQFATRLTADLSAGVRSGGNSEHLH